MSLHCSLSQSVGFVGLGLCVVLSHADSARGETLYDYLVAKGVKKSIAGDRTARTFLWSPLFPGEAYQGTAEQNGRFLAELKRLEASPQLVLLHTGAVLSGAVIEATAMPISRVVVESELAGVSCEVRPGERVKLGTVSHDGLYALRWSADEKTWWTGTLWVQTTEPGKFTVDYVAGLALKGPAEIIGPRDGDLASGVSKFVKYIVETNSLQKALGGVKVTDWIAENAANLSTTIAVCAITFVPQNPVKATTGRACVASTASLFTDFTVTVLLRVADDMGNRLSEKERSALKSLFKGANFGAQIALSLWGSEQSSKICKLTDATLAGVDTAVGTVSANGFRLVLKVLIQEGRKVTTLLCIENL